MKDKVLIVDDVKMNCEMLGEMLEDEYDIVTAQGGREALQILREHYKEFVVILLDLMMPEVDGFMVLEVMKNQKWTDETPVIVISGESSKAAERRSMELGVSDFIHKPFDNYLVKQRVRNIAELFSYKRSLEKKVEMQTAALRKQYKMLQLQAGKIKESSEKVIDMLGTFVQYRNLEGSTHIMCAKELTRILAAELMKEYPEYGLTEEMIDRIVSATAIRDIGKVAIPDSVLLKPAKLTEEEHEYIKSHAARGGEILRRIKGVWDEEFANTCYDICRYHHEKYDGRGYPEGLAGDAIPISAQIVSITDCYEELVSERVYKVAYPPDQAFHMIVSGECGVFSPKLLTCFRNVRKEFEKVVEEHANM